MHGIARDYNIQLPQTKAETSVDYMEFLLQADDEILKGAFMETPTIFKRTLEVSPAITLRVRRFLYEGGNAAGGRLPHPQRHAARADRRGRPPRQSARPLGVGRGVHHARW